MFSSVQEVSGGLRKAGYIADSVAITTVFLASSLHRPVFSEGPAGSGKTQLAYAVAQAANTNVERLQCYEGIGEDKAIGKFDESLQRLCVELKAKASGVDWDLLKNELQGGSSSSAQDRFFAHSNMTDLAFCSSTNWTR